MGDISARLLTLTSYISRQFFHFLEDLVFGDLNRFPGDLLAFSSGQHQEPSNVSYCEAVSEGCSSLPGPCHLYSREVHDERASDLQEQLHLYSRHGIVDSSYTHQAVELIIEGSQLIWQLDYRVGRLASLPLFGLKSAWKVALATWRFSLRSLRRAEAQMQSFISRVHKTFRGSSDDVGWLHHTSGLPPTEDGTARFCELLKAIRNGSHMLPDSFVYLLIPGLFSSIGPLYFVNTKRFFSKMGLACHIAKVHSEASVEHNAWELKQYIEELYWGSGKQLMLLGHSKGGVDAAAALSIYWSELQDKVAGLAMVQCPYGGSPIASDILREGQIADKETRRIVEFFICKIIKGDIRALEDLTYEKRKEFIMGHKLPENIPLISFRSEANVALGVVATLSHIAHAELPWLPFPRTSDQESHRVPLVMPASAAMALCALHLQLRYGAKSDGLVACLDAEVPGSVVVRPVQKLDHSWMVYSAWKKNPNEPDASEMCEALLAMLVERGKTMQEEGK